jgi:hypothetical protein
MKFEKKHWIMLIVGVVVLYLVWYFLSKKKKTESSYDSLPLIGSENSFNPDIMIPDADEWGGGESGYGRVANVKVGVGGGTVNVLTCPKGYTLNTYTYAGNSYSLCERGHKSIAPVDAKSEANFAGARSASMRAPMGTALNKPCTKNGVIIDCDKLPKAIKLAIINS